MLLLPPSSNLFKSCICFNNDAFKVSNCIWFFPTNGVIKFAIILLWIFTGGFQYPRIRHYGLCWRWPRWGWGPRTRDDEADYHYHHPGRQCPDAPGGIFSNSIKLMLERQKITLYQQDMLFGRQKSTLYQHAAREAKTHTLPAGYAGTEGKNYTLLAPCSSRP